ncbi:MAG: heavy-metal-associated domain-containing protein [Xenococcaceae cyanobacterium MO_188.B29]|nr:heavy-metal-associated domain-containing protein [Xenococcaceae cyanobacterium MO_188.B29]
MIELKVPSMVCEGCVETVTKAIKTHEPDATVNVDLDSKQVNIDTQASVESIKQIIVATGHEVE